MNKRGRVSIIHPRDGDLVLREAVMWKADRRKVTEVPGSNHWEDAVAPRGTAIAFYLNQ